MYYIGRELCGKKFRLYTNTDVIGIDLGGTNIAAEEKKVVMAQLFNDAGIIGSAMLAI